MTIAIDKTKEEQGLFDLVDDWLRRDRFVFVGWSGFYYSQQLTLL